MAAKNFRIARKETWPDLLLGEIQVHAGLPFEYGKSDCLTFAMDCVKAMTGVDLMEGARDYSTIEGAYKRLKQRGFDTLAEALGASLEEIPQTMAQRGDVGVIKGDGFMVAVVFVGPHVVGKDEPFGTKSVSRALVTQAFRVP